MTSVYDVLTGDVVRRLQVHTHGHDLGREDCIRDVAWHPFENYIISTSVRRFEGVRVRVIITSFSVGQSSSARAMASFIRCNTNRTATVATLHAHLSVESFVLA
jgi:hypothetical protein